MVSGHRLSSRVLAISSLFGALITVQKLIFPAPYDKVVSVMVQAALLSLSFFMFGLAGPMLTGLVSGLLTAVFRGGLAWMTFGFALLYGVLVGLFHLYLGVVVEGVPSRRRVAASCMLASLVVGALSGFTAIYLGIVPFNIHLVGGMFLAGAIQGILGGLFSCEIWSRLKKTYVFSSD